MIAKIVTSIAAALAYLKLHHTLRAEPYTSVGALRVYALADSREEAAALRTRVIEAIGLLQQTSPRRARRVVTDVKRILVTDNPTATAVFMPAMSAIVLDQSIVRDHPVTTIAGLLVHEVTHARIWNHRIRDKRVHHTRLERRCNLEMLDAARRMPNAHHLEQWANSLIMQAASYEHEMAELNSRKSAWMRELGVPEKLVRIIGRYFLPS